MTSLEEVALPLEWETPLFRQAVSQFEQALEFAEIDDALAERLSAPERSVIVSVPVRLDDGRRAVYPGHRVQHSSVLGPTKGGVRFSTGVTLGECAALAMWMTWKWALLRRAPTVAPRGDSLRAAPALARRARAPHPALHGELLPVIGPQEDIPAPDMATDDQTWRG